jgi:hypothetical protein
LAVEIEQPWCINMESRARSFDATGAPDAKLMAAKTVRMVEKNILRLVKGCVWASRSLEMDSARRSLGKKKRKMRN